MDKSEIIRNTVIHCDILKAELLQRIEDRLFRHMVLGGRENAIQRAIDIEAEASERRRKTTREDDVSCPNHETGTKETTSESKSDHKRISFGIRKKRKVVLDRIPEVQIRM